MDPQDEDDNETFSHESVQEIRQRIRMMRNLVDTDVGRGTKSDSGSGEKRQSIDTGNFLSFTFGFILFLIVAVGFYAFRNLYHAVVKRFSQ